MSAPAAPGSPEMPSLLGITIRRALVSGRLYIGIGLVISILVMTSIAAAGGTSFVTIAPLILPLYAVIGGMGGLMVFTNDRLKGVYEYLIAYGVSTRHLFANVLIASLVLVLIILAPTLAISVSIYLLRGHAVTAELVGTVFLYGIGMSCAAVSLAAILGMYWSSLSTPREGMNSPIGLIPIVGEVAPLFALIFAIGSRGTDTLAIMATAVLVVVVIVLVLLSQVGRLLLPERLLSPA